MYILQIGTASCEVLDLLANCNITPEIDDYQDLDVEYAEIQDMGLWHSTPLAKRHKSKISLTWVLKENLESAKLAPQKQNEEKMMLTVGKDVERSQRISQNLNENENRKCKPGEARERVAGRNEYYHKLRLRTACEELTQNTYSDTSVGTEEYMRRKHRHRHRRKKKHSNGKFGYDIRDLDSFLTEVRFLVYLYLLNSHEFPNY